MQNLGRVGKNSGPNLSRLWTKVHNLLRQCRTPLAVTNALAWLCILWFVERYRTLNLLLRCEIASWLLTHLPDCLYHVSFRRYRPLNLPSSCKVVEKMWFLNLRFVGGGDTTDLGHAFSFSNCTYFRQCGRFSLSSIQQARRLLRLEGKK